MIITAPSFVVCVRRTRNKKKKLENTKKKKGFSWASLLSLLRSLSVVQ